MQKYTQNMRMEERENEIDTEMTEIYVMLAKICEKVEEAEQTDETEKKKIQSRRRNC